MRAYELLNEKASRGRPIVCVDVQPAYAQWLTPDYVWSVAKFLANQNAPILMYVNADQSGITEDNLESDIIPFWEEAFNEVGADFQTQGLPKMEFYDKGYGYLRGWMDEGIDKRIIIQVIRELYRQDEFSTQDMFEGDPEKLEEFVRSFTGRLYRDIPVPSTITDEPLTVGWAALDQLKRYNNCYLIGGGRNECLAEVALLMNAFNIKYKMINELIY